MILTINTILQPGDLIHELECTARVDSFDRATGMIKYTWVDVSEDYAGILNIKSCSSLENFLRHSNSYTPKRRKSKTRPKDLT